jgi:hypothetical protein
VFLDGGDAPSDQRDVADDGIDPRKGRAATMKSISLLGKSTLP